MIKPLFGIDCTENKDNEVTNFDRFCVQRVSPALKDSLESASLEAQETLESMKLPKILRWIQMFSGVGALCIVAGLLKGVLTEDGPTIPQAYENAPALFWVAGACVIIWGVLVWMASRRVKAFAEKEETALLSSKLESIASSIYHELGVPEDATEVDIPLCRYKIKKDTVKHEYIYSANTAHINGNFRIYINQQSLYFANLEGKFAVPVSSLRKIQRVDKSFSAYGWTKETEPNKEPYSQYKLSVDKNDVVRYKPYYELTMQYENEEWSVVIPAYELPVYESITGIKATVV